MISVPMAYARPSSIDFSKLVTDGDELKIQWCKQVTAKRKEFFLLADHSSRNLAPLRDQYKQAYKDFHQYLTTTIDMIEMLPQNIQHKLSFEYSSGISNKSLVTAQCGNKSIIQTLKHLASSRW